MQAQTWNKVRALAWAIGLAAALTALLLVWAAERAPAMQAMDRSSPGAPAEPGAGTQFNGVGPAWVVTEPVEIFVPNDSTVYWNIEKYNVNVVITIPTTAFEHDDGAMFTFTPRTDLRLDSSWASLPYFFDLKGVFVGHPGEVSLTDDIEINVEYLEEDLDDILPESLEAFWYDPRPDEWLQQGTRVNTLSKRVIWRTWLTGSFGIGGRRLTLLYLPTIMR